MKFCKVADITDWQDQEFQSISSLLGLDDFKDRNVWEQIQVYRGLLHLDLLQEDVRAIGLGAGQERLIYAFANRCGEVIATDTYNSQNRQAGSPTVDEVYEKNPFPYRRDRLLVRNMDLSAIDYPDNSFDMVWSCRLEHTLTFEDLHRVYREIHRVLKPGGIAALTTEYNMTDRHSYEPHMLLIDRHWIRHWLTANNPLLQGFELLDSPTLELADVEGNEPQSRRVQPRTSIPIYSRDIILNSVSFFLRKIGDFSRSYDSNWLPEPLKVYLHACDQQRNQDFADSEMIFKQLIDAPVADARLRVAALRRLMVSLRSQKKTSEMMEYGKLVMPLCTEAEDTDHLLPLANQCKKLGLWEEAHYLYEKIENLPGARDVQIVRSILGQAEYFAQLNQFKTALTLADKAAQFLPVYRLTDEASNVHYHRGLYNEKLGQLNVAMESYQSAIEASSPPSKLRETCTQRFNLCYEALQQQPKQKSKIQRFKGWVNRLWNFALTQKR
ncbi:methyltransferase domain-containing protein [Egbenema bharatensis]|uniref:methyltransferase domain-containing protein n=1 Tax=Egbenema bharatensis TaxID=3463334 RepID=UPI003A89710E